MHKNIKAFLDMLAWSELGPKIIAQSDRGYNVLVGSLPGKVNLFTDYSDHPRKLIKIKQRNGTIIPTTAAGRYQILKRTFDHYKQALDLPDFSPVSQDKIAIQLIIDCGAEDKINEGKIVDAIDKVKKIWASLPGAGYSQPEHRIEPLLIAYRAAGGEIA